MLTVTVGYAVMAYMVYLIMVTQMSAPKIWDPYDILGVARVSLHALTSLVPFDLILTLFSAERR